jgi:hypothetical protein
MWTSILSYRLTRRRLWPARTVLSLNADLQAPEQVLADKRVRELFDFDQPVGIIFICVPHCMWDKEVP